MAHEYRIDGRQARPVSPHTLRPGAPVWVTRHGGVRPDPYLFHRDEPILGCVWVRHPAEERPRLVDLGEHVLLVPDETALPG